MAGYAFGSVIALDAFITMISFIGVIVFILFFDMMIELMEYFLEGTKLYHNMIQMIYKELMLMGLVSFTIVMITATQKTQHITNPTVTEWITSVDYSHILLFFLTFFFVIHAFYLMRKAILCGTDYRKSAKMKLSDLIQEMKKLQDRKVDSMLFQLQYIPFSQIRDHIEFYLLQSLFRDTYWLPEDFHFSEYLSNCFNRHALKTVNRTWITWVTLIIFAVLNYGRVQLHIGFGSCHAEVAAAHGNSTITDDHHVATDDHGTAVTHSVVAQLMQSVMTSGNRYLEASSSSSSSHADDDLSNTCRYNYVKLFLSSAVVLCGYTFLIVFISRLYKIRMLHRIGLQSPEDYLDFLEFSQAEDERKKRMKALEKKLGKPIGNKNKDPVRITNALLKQDIERVLDADEHGHHEEAEFRVIAEFLAHIFNTTKEYAQMLILKIRISLNRGVSALGSASGDEDDDVNIGAASGKSGDNGSVSDSETRSGELVGGSPNRRSALKKTKSILRRESVTEVVDSREKSFYHHQHEKKEFMDKLVSTQPNKRKWSVVKNNATAPDPASNSNTAGSTSNQSIDRQSLSSPPHHDLAIIKEDSNGRGSNSGHSAGSDKETKPSHEPHHGPPPVQAKVPNERSRRRSVIDLIHHMDLPDLDQERNMTFTAAHNVQHHGIGNSLRVAAQHANTKETSIRGAAGVGGDGHSIADNHGTHAHPPAHQNSVPAPTISIRRAPSQDEEPHSAKHHVKNSVVVHAPEHGYSTVEKFLKKQNEEHHLMMLQMEQHGGHHSGSSGILGTMRHVGDALSVRGGGGGGGNGAASMRKAHVNPVSTRMKAVSIRRVQKPAQTDVETGKEAEAEAEDEEEVRLTADFSDIYLFGNVVYFHRAVELCILFNCLYMAFWTTDFIAITSHIEQSVLWRWLDQLAMIIPVVLVLPCIGYIAETCSLLNAIATLNLEVVYEVLEDWEDTNRITSDLRKKIMTRIAVLENAMEDKVQIIHELFDEIDQDGSGRIDKIEFRFLLRTLKLTYSDDRFNRLFRAVDSSGEGSIGWEELFTLLFPDEENSPSSPSTKAGNESAMNSTDAVKPFDGHDHPPHPHSFIPTPITIGGQASDDRDNIMTPRSMSSSKRAPPPQVETVQEIEDVEDEDEDRDTELPRSSLVEASHAHPRSLSNVSYSDTDSENDKPSPL